MIELWETFLYMLDDTDESNNNYNNNNAETATDNAPSNGPTTTSDGNAKGIATDGEQATNAGVAQQSSIPEGGGGPGQPQTGASSVVSVSGVSGQGSSPPLSQAETATATDVALEQDA